MPTPILFEKPFTSRTYAIAKPEQNKKYISWLSSIYPSFNFGFG